MASCRLKPNKTGVCQDRVISEGIETGRDSPCPKMVCSKLVISLSHTVAVYGQLCLAIGGSSDNDDLRKELQKQRAIACDISKKTKDQLIPLYKNQTSNAPSLSSTSECDLEKLCFLFSGCLELLKIELTKSLSLHRLFPSGSTCLINTGVTESILGTSTSRKSITSVTSLTDRYRNDDDHIASIEKDISCIKTLENDVDRIISVQPWNIEPDAHYFGARDNTSQDSDSLEIKITRRMERNRGKYLWITLVIFAIATVTGSVIGLTLGLS